MLAAFVSSDDEQHIHNAVLMLRVFSTLRSYQHCRYEYHRPSASHATDGGHSLLVSQAPTSHTSRAESSSGKSEAVTLTSTLVCASRLREMICRGLTATTWTRDAEIDSTLDTASVARSAPLVVSNSLKVSPFSCKSASTEKVLVDGAAPEVRDGFIRRVGEAVGLPVGTSVGVAVGFAVGFAVGVPVGVPVGVAEGVAVGAPEGSPPPEAVGPPAVSVGDELTFEVGEPPGTGLCKGLEGEAMHTASAWH